MRAINSVFLGSPRASIESAVMWTTSDGEAVSITYTAQGGAVERYYHLVDLETRTTIEREEG